MVNNVGYVISGKDLALGPETSLDHSELLCGRSFIKVKKGQRKLLTQTSEGGRAPLASVSKGAVSFFNWLLQ